MSSLSSEERLLGAIVEKRCFPKDKGKVLSDKGHGSFSVFVFGCVSQKSTNDNMSIQIEVNISKRN